VLADEGDEHDRLERLMRPIVPVSDDERQVLVMPVTHRHDHASTGPIQLLGGTGDFEDLQGHGVDDGTADFEAGVGHATITGFVVEGSM